MGTTVAEISMSLDGFVTGPDPGPEQGLGRGGEPIHAWVFEGDETDQKVLAGAAASVGAVVMGRRTFDNVDGPRGWQAGEGYAPGHQPSPPIFVVTHRAPATVRLPRVSFVTDGPAAAISRAVTAADGKDVSVMGGADVVRQAVRLGLADELRIHLSPVLLGEGTRLFGGGELQLLRQDRVQVSAQAIHITYRL